MPDNVLWGLIPAIGSSQRLRRLEDLTPPAIDWINRDRYAAYANARSMAAIDGHLVGQIEGADLSKAPTPRFKATAEDFAPDLFFLGELFASKRLIETLALPQASVQLLPVDCSACPPAMRAQDYKVLNLLTFANPMDRERSWPSIYTDVELSDGTSTFLWSAEPWQPGMPVPRLFWREDFIAPAPLFRVPGKHWAMATDALAGRVIRAGFDDVMFHDLTNDGSRTYGLIVRTLDGTRIVE